VLIAILKKQLELLHRLYTSVRLEVEQGRLVGRDAQFGCAVEAREKAWNGDFLEQRQAENL
jgi:hypothetical protein